MLTGALAGTCAGLFGIGGGLIFVPALLFIFPHQGISPEVIAQLAVGTSLSAIIPTTMSSALRHYQKNGIHWSIFASLGGGMVLGACIGIFVARSLSSSILQVGLGCFVLFMAVHMFFSGKKADKKQTIAPAKWLQTLSGVCIGSISAMFGIGGGSFTVPLLTKYGFDIRQAVGTSSACSFLIALTGTVMSLTAGGVATENLSGSTGMVYWPAFASIVPFSMVFARVGTDLAHKLDPARLRTVFTLFLIFIGMRLILGSFF